MILCIHKNKYSHGCHSEISNQCCVTIFHIEYLRQDVEERNHGETQDHMWNDSQESSVIYDSSLSDRIHNVAQEIMIKAIPISVRVTNGSARIFRRSKCKRYDIKAQAEYWKIRQILFFEFIHMYSLRHNKMDMVLKIWNLFVINRNQPKRNLQSKMDFRSSK